LTAVTIACAFGVVKSLPDGDAHADPLVVKTKEVQSISIDGGRGLPMATLREVMQTKVGAIVDTATLEQDRRALEHQLAQRGYLAAKVASPVVSFGPQGGVYVVFDVERGPLYHVRNVRLDGPSWADAGVLPIASGDDAATGRLERVRQAATDTLARHGKRLQVELTVEPDHADAMIDVRFTTR
jgi:outer membrane protein assembly factor BamA